MNISALKLRQVEFDGAFGVRVSSSPIDSCLPANPKAAEGWPDLAAPDPEGQEAPWKGLARSPAEIGAALAMGGLAEANLFAEAAGGAGGGAVIFIWTVAIIWALKSSTCFKRNCWRFVASAPEMPVEGTEAPKEKMGAPAALLDECTEVADELPDTTEDTAGVVVAGVGEVVEVEGDAEELVVGGKNPGKAPKIGEGVPSPDPFEWRVERPKRLAAPPPRLFLLVFPLEYN